MAKTTSKQKAQNAAKEAAAPKTISDDSAQAAATKVDKEQKTRTAPGKEKMVNLKETGLPGPGEKTPDGGTSGNPHAVPEGTSASQYQRGANMKDTGFEDVPGSRPLALKQAIDGFERQLDTLIPKWSPTESKLAKEKLGELRKLAETGVNKQRPDAWVEPTA